MTERKPEWPCIRCFEVKPMAAFGIGRTGKQVNRVCFECKETEAYEMDARRVNVKARVRRKRATWVDDEGVTVRECCDCGDVKPLEQGFLISHRREDGSAQRCAYCRKCQSKRVTKRRRKREAADPERAAAVRAVEAQKARERRARDPEKAREAGRRRRAKVKADPQLVVRERENARIAHRLRREQAGLSTRQGPAKVSRRRTAPSYLPSAPLAALVERIIDERVAVAEVMGDRAAFGGETGEVCEMLGVNPRTYTGWRSGEYASVRIGMAERVLMNAGVEWYEVYSYDDHAAQFLAVEVEA